MRPARPLQKKGANTPKNLSNGFLTRTRSFFLADPAAARRWPIPPQFTIPDGTHHGVLGDPHDPGTLLRSHAILDHLGCRVGVLQLRPGRRRPTPNQGQTHPLCIPLILFQAIQEPQEARLRDPLLIMLGRALIGADPALPDPLPELADGHSEKPRHPSHRHNLAMFRLHMCRQRGPFVCQPPKGGGSTEVFQTLWGRPPRTHVARSVALVTRRSGFPFHGITPLSWRLAGRGCAAPPH